MELKPCTACKKDLPLSSFMKKGLRSNVQRYRSDCKDCFNAKQDNKSRYDKDTLKEYQLKRNFGLTLEAYNLMLKSQNGVCAICEGVNQNGRALSVDHDHGTGLIRQLLCNNCNAALGLFKDNPNVLIKASAYLVKHKLT